MPRHALHAHFLTLPHPATGEALHLHAPAPDDLLTAWIALGGTIPADLEAPPPERAGSEFKVMTHCIDG